MVDGSVPGSSGLPAKVYLSKTVNPKLLPMAAPVVCKCVCMSSWWAGWHFVEKFHRCQCVCDLSSNVFLCNYIGHFKRNCTPLSAFFKLPSTLIIIEGFYLFIYYYCLIICCLVMFFFQLNSCLSLFVWIFCHLLWYMYASTISNSLYVLNILGEESNSDSDLMHLQCVASFIFFTTAHDSFFIT